MKQFFHIVILSLGASATLISHPTDIAELVVEARSENLSLTVPGETQARAVIRSVPGGAEVGGSERYLGGRASTVADTFALSPGVIENANSTDQRQFLPGDGHSLFAGLEWKW